MATIKDIASITGLSLATISKYLNGGNVLPENRELLQNAIESLGYRRNQQARGLKTNETMTIGVLIPSFENIFFTTIASTIESYLSAHGYGMILCAYNGNGDIECEKLNFLLDKNVDGLVVVSYGGAFDILEKIHKQKIPLVLLDHKVEGLEEDYVGVDNFQSTYNATAVLLEHGHRDIALIGGCPKNYTAKERIRGYREALAHAKIPSKPHYITEQDLTVLGGSCGFHQIWECEEKPTAVVVTNYEMTIGALMAVNEMEIAVPQEISLMGFDNILLSQAVRPPLSVVEQPMEKIGEEVAKLLLRRMKKDYTDYPQVVELETQVLIRQSITDISIKNLK